MPTQETKVKEKRQNLAYKDLLPAKNKKTLKRDYEVENQLVPSSSKKRKRVGRGRASGMGKTSSRGHKGQKARSGYSRHFGFEGGQMPLYRRIPKRGFQNINHKVYQIVNLEDLEKLDLKENTIHPKVLKENGLIRKSSDRVKILAKGKITKLLHVTADAFSKSAENKIKEAGGSFTLRTHDSLKAENQKENLKEATTTE